MGGASNFKNFWPAYVCAHRKPGTRAIHLVGTLLGWILLLAAIASRHGWWILGALVLPYALAWVSHFLVEHNRPASFEHPLWSWWADQRMVALMLTGKMNQEVHRCTTLRNESALLERNLTPGPAPYSAGGS